MEGNQLRRLDGDISPCDVLTLFSPGGFGNILSHENSNVCLPASIYLCWQINLHIHHLTSPPGHPGCAQPLHKRSPVTSLETLWQMLFSLLFLGGGHGLRQVICPPRSHSWKVTELDLNPCGLHPGTCFETCFSSLLLSDM